MQRWARGCWARAATAWRSPNVTACGDALPPLLQVQATLTLEAPLQDYTVLEVACLLRLVYRPSNASTEGFRAVSAHLLGVLRLANQLEMEGLVAGISEFVCSGSSSTGLALEQLAEWVTLAERLHLDALRTHCVCELTDELLHNCDLVPARAVASIIPHISSDTWGVVLSSLVAAWRKSAGTVANLTLPAAADLQVLRWQPPPPPQHTAPFVWKVTGATALLNGNEPFMSRAFTRGERRWQVVVKPGFTILATTLVHVHLLLADVADKGGAHARCDFIIRNQVRAGDCAG